MLPSPPSDSADFSSESLWLALSRTPGIGVSITDADGQLLFVNDTAMVLFSDAVDIDYQGKSIADFHSAPFVEERLAMIRRVIHEGKPLRIRHLYHGRRLESTVWPIQDHRPPYHRVLIVSHLASGTTPDLIPANDIESIDSAYIDLGPYNILTRRELEVFVMLGHGLSVPRTAAILHRSAKTIQRHKASITKKLGLRGQAEVVQFVTEMGLDLQDTQRTRLPT